MEPELKIDCSHHGVSFAAFICEHLLSNPTQKWFSNKPVEEDRWPDAWCASCEALFLEYGEWNEQNQPKREIVAVCHHCYEGLRGQESTF
jgi:hypothetical protein